MASSAALSSPSRGKIDQPLQCAILLLLATVAIYNFVRRDSTAFEWPGIDMGCYFERQDDPAFLSGDYFTNSVSQPNPRHVFGSFVLGLAWILGTDWYGAFFALRCALTVAMPTLWYLALWGMLKPRLKSEQARLVAQVGIGLAIVLVMRRDVQAWFSIAWWSPYQLYVGAQPVSQAACLLAIVLRTWSRPWGSWLSFPTWFVASMIHPPMALFMVTFYWLWMFDWRRGRELAADLACAVVLPFSLLWALYRPTSPLPAAEFIYYYAHVVHPFHYVVSEFETLTSHGWWVSFTMIVAMLSASMGVAAINKNWRLTGSSGLFLLAYAGCVWLQYLGTEAWPNKSIVILGPSRFSILGYFMVLLVTVELVSDLWPDSLVKWPHGVKLADRIQWLRSRYALLGGIVAVVAMYGILRDDLQYEIRGRYAGLYDWIEQTTDPADVFLTPFDSLLHRDLPIIGHRAVYASQAFPFCEEVWPEHIRRFTLAYGELSELQEVAGKDLIRKRAQFARELGREEILRLADSYRLDYVVVEADRPSALATISPCYGDASVKVYAVSALRESAYPAPSRLPVIATEPQDVSALRK